MGNPASPPIAGGPAGRGRIAAGWPGAWTMGTARNRWTPDPRLERMEGRELPSGLMVALANNAGQLTAGQVASIASSNASALTQTIAAGVGSGAGSGVYVGNGSISNPAGTPTGPNASAPFPNTPLVGNAPATPAELAREKFVAHFSGPMVTQPPRFQDQSKILFLRGLGGSTPNFFLHGDYSLAMVFPKNFNPKNPGGTGGSPTDPGYVAPVTGFAFLDDKNNNSGGVVGLDLLADPTSFDAKGRPTRLTFTSDPNVYGGIFYVSQSSGVVTITYGKNTAKAAFNGRLYTTGLTSPFQNVDLYAQHSG